MVAPALCVTYKHLGGPEMTVGVNASQPYLGTEDLPGVAGEDKIVEDCGDEFGELLGLPVEPAVNNKVMQEWKWRSIEK